MRKTDPHQIVYKRYNKFKSGHSNAFGLGDLCDFNAETLQKHGHRPKKEPRIYGMKANNSHS